MTLPNFAKDRDALLDARDRLSRANGRAAISNALLDFFAAFEVEVSRSLPFNARDFRMDLITARDDLLRLIDAEYDWLDSREGRAATRGDMERGIRHG